MDARARADIGRVRDVLVAIAADEIRAERTPGAATPPAAAVPAVEPASPLAVLAARAGLSPTATTLLRILVVGEVDRHAQRALLRLCSDPAPSGVGCDGLIAAAERLGVDPLDALAELAPGAPLIERGLVTIANPAPSMVVRRVVVPPRVVAFACDGAVPAGIESPALLAEPVLPLERVRIDRDTIDALADALASRVSVWVVGGLASGRRTLLASLLGARGQRLLCLEGLDASPALLPGLWREALLLDAVICIRAAGEEPDKPAPSWPRLYGVLARGGLPVVWISEDPPPIGELDPSPAVVRIPRAGLSERAVLWRDAVPGLDVEAAGELAARYQLPPGRIVLAGAEAQRSSTGPGAELAHVARAVSTLVAQQVSTLGVRVDDTQTWDDVVLPDDVLAAVREMISRVRHRYRVLEQWGFRRKLSKGVGMAALFGGPPGTGKTMIASLIARDLGLELYQIDLSRIVSKWVGETEKNLARVFDAAEGASVLLLFDEADALFTKRTEVKSSNDRYANSEVNYLLQRVERFEGVSILTTNLEGSIDPAFKRRLAFRITFPIPDADERIRLWQRTMPREAAVEEGLDYRRLGETYEISGGLIRNAVLRAAYLAAGEHVPIGMTHLEQAVRLEYRDAGKLGASGRID